MKNKENRIFSERYWQRVFLHTLMFTGITAIIVSTVGVLALPVIMSYLYSWKWMFLYLVYLYVMVKAMCYNGSEK